MRTLKRNKIALWLVQKDSDPINEVDVDGNYTGEVSFNYSTPVKIYLSIYPAEGAVIERSFGRDASVDMVAVSNDIKLNRDSLIFLQEPTSDFDSSYDYRVEEILESLNTNKYGLKGRV